MTTSFVFGDSRLLIWLPIVLGLAAVCIVWGASRRVARIGVYVAQERGRASVWKVLRPLRIFCVLCAVALAVLAIARPRWGFEWIEVQRRGIDIMVAIDVSKSMLATDFSPSRIARARRSVLDLTREASGDRVGLVAFAGSAFVQCPLTVDHGAVRMFLDYIDPDLIPTPGTNVADAIRVSLAAISDGGLGEAVKADSDERPGRVIILITDGEDFSDEALEAAAEAEKAGVRIFTIGLGDPGGAPVPEVGGGFRKDTRGQVVLSRLNEDLLSQIASATGGHYVHATSAGREIEMIYREHIRGKIEERDLGSGRERRWFERYQWFAGLAFLALVLEALLAIRGRSPRVPRRASSEGAKAGVGAAVLFAFAFFSSVATTPIVASPGSASVSAGGPAASKARASLSTAEAARMFNNGVAQYRAGDFAGARESFAAAATAEDSDLSARALYNLGNASAASGDLDGGTQAWNRAVQKNPGDQQARENLEWAEEQKKQQKQNEQKQDEQKQDEQKQDGDSKDSQQQSGQENSDNRSDQQKNQSEGSKEERENSPGRAGDDSTKSSEDSTNPNGNAGDKDGEKTSGASGLQPTPGSEESRAAGDQEKKQDAPADGSEKPGGQSTENTAKDSSAREEQSAGGVMSRAEAEQLLRGVPDTTRRYRYRPSGAGEPPPPRAQGEVRDW